MTSEVAEDTAKQIASDRSGADYYEDPKILAGFLAGRFGISVEAAKKTADAIAEDRSGADYYADPKILAEFLDSQLGE